MSAERKLIVFHRPQPEGRAKLSARGGFARAYTPSRTRKAKEALALEIKAAWSGLPVIEGPVRLVVKFYSVRSGAKAADVKAEALRFVKPDLDNLEKLVMDAITQSGCAWLDDSQVAVKVSEKRICRAGAERTEIEVSACAPLTVSGKKSTVASEAAKEAVGDGAVCCRPDGIGGR